MKPVKQKISTDKSSAKKKTKVIVIGTRASPLALWQAKHVKKMIENEFGDIKVSIKEIQTTGDKLKKPLYEEGGKGLFLKEIEEHLLAGKVDLGVHSLKDMPVVLEKGLQLAAILKREDPRDVFVSDKYKSLLFLPKKAKIGTGSLRRRAQLKSFRPDFEIVPIRGNVETRLKKIKSENLAGVVLAAAGLTRLGMSEKITEYVDSKMMLPAIGQGAIALEIREGDEFLQNLLKTFEHEETALCVQAERAFLRELGGDCKSPIAAFCEKKGDTLILTGLIAGVDGREILRDRVEGISREPDKLGVHLAKKLFALGAREVIRSNNERLTKK